MRRARARRNISPPWRTPGRRSRRCRAQCCRGRFGVGEARLATQARTWGQDSCSPLSDLLELGEFVGLVGSDESGLCLVRRVRVLRRFVAPLALEAAKFVLDLSDEGTAEVLWERIQNALLRQVRTWTTESREQRATYGETLAGGTLATLPARRTKTVGVGRDHTRLVATGKPGESRLDLGGRQLELAPFDRSQRLHDCVVDNNGEGNHGGERDRTGEGMRWGPRSDLKVGEQARGRFNVEGAAQISLREISGNPALAISQGAYKNNQQQRTMAPRTQRHAACACSSKTGIPIKFSCSGHDACRTCIARRDLWRGPVNQSLVQVDHS